MTEKFEVKAAKIERKVAEQFVLDSRKHSRAAFNQVALLEEKQ